MRDLRAERDPGAAAEVSRREYGECTINGMRNGGGEVTRGRLSARQLSTRRPVHSPR